VDEFEGLYNRRRRRRTPCVSMSGIHWQNFWQTFAVKFVCHVILFVTRLTE
jgi:hypothetical protein